MADVAKQMFKGALAAADAQLYAGLAAGSIVRNIHVHNIDTVARPLRITAGTDAIGNALFWDFSVPAGSVYDWSGFIALGADTLRGHTSAANVMLTIISGVEL